MNIPYGEPKTWKHSKTRIRKSRKGYERLINEQVKRMRLGKLDRKRFKAVSGRAARPGMLRNSDIDARCKFAKYVAQEVRELASGSTREFYFLTLLADEGIMPIHAPELALRRLRGKAFRAMQSIGLDGFHTVEVQALTNWSFNGTGTSLLAHVHMVGWSAEGQEPLTIADMTDVLCGDGTRSNAAWTSVLGARPVVITKLDAKYGCPSYAAAYALKLPHDAKKREPKKAPGKFRLRSIMNGYRPIMAMRIHELNSLMLFGSHVGGVGDGAGMIKRCKDKAVRGATRRREAFRANGKVVDAFDEQAFWARTRRRRKPKYKPIFIDGANIR
jgi:hypothetical protein